MEGLIPMVYKAIKKNKIRRQYECLSSGSGSALPFNPAGFYISDIPGNSIAINNAAKKFHRRSYSSVEGFSVKDRRWTDTVTAAGVSPPRTKQLKRFGSHRMFSCVTGC
ncbi:uncharacterized protein [Euphorbia lathyris]|uniref:uncharacterized protein n=1 Tax=Euphorbia lathyris TaxID=212925 RepID=UPI0033131AB5